jgi:hypothetical protein
VTDEAQVAADSQEEELSNCHKEMLLSGFENWSGTSLSIDIVRNAVNRWICSNLVFIDIERSSDSSPVDYVRSLQAYLSIV